MPVKDDGRNLVPGGGGGESSTAPVAAADVSHKVGDEYAVQLPAGGTLHLQTAEEVELWEQSSTRYVNDYGLTQTNDLVLVGSILSQQLLLFRAQTRASGMEPEFDQHDRPTGKYKRVNVKPSDLTTAQTIMTKCAEEIRNMERALGIDKKTREAGGAQTVAAYVSTLKSAAREYGLHVSKRMKSYERVMMEARWKLRLLRNGDAEDKAYHHISEGSILQWLEKELQDLEDVDRKFANEVGKLYVGKLK